MLSENGVLAKDFKQISLFGLMNGQILRCHLRFVLRKEMAETRKGEWVAMVPNKAITVHKGIRSLLF